MIFIDFGLLRSPYCKLAEKQWRHTDLVIRVKIWQPTYDSVCEDNSWIHGKCRQRFLSNVYKRFFYFFHVFTFFNVFYFYLNVYYIYGRGYRTPELLYDFLLVYSLAFRSNIYRRHGSRLAAIWSHTVGICRHLVEVPTLSTAWPTNIT